MPALLAAETSWRDHVVAPALPVTIPEDPLNFELIDISSDATVIVGNEQGDWNVSYNNWYPFFWRDGMEHLEPVGPVGENLQKPQGYLGKATGVSGNGKWMIGDYATTEDHYAAFIYSIEEDAFEYLQIAGLVFANVMAPQIDESHAAGISDDGSVVVGWWRPEGGLQQAFVWSGSGGDWFEPVTNWDELTYGTRAVAVSGDGKTVVVERDYITSPERSALFTETLVLKDGELRPLPVPDGFYVSDIHEVTSDVILGAILKPGAREEPGWLFSYDQLPVRWNLNEDRYEIFSVAGFWSSAEAVSQNASGTRVTILRHELGPADGPVQYGSMWSTEGGTVDLTHYLSGRYGIDFDGSAVSRALIDLEGDTIVAEVYPTRGHYRKELARFDLQAPVTPMSMHFPDAMFSGGCWSTPLGTFLAGDYPYAWWYHFGWVWFAPRDAADAYSWIWNRDMGWCAYLPAVPNHLYSLTDAEWLRVLGYAGWLYSDSRGWFQPGASGD